MAEALSRIDVSTAFSVLISLIMAAIVLATGLVQRSLISRNHNTLILSSRFSAIKYYSDAVSYLERRKPGDGIANYTFESLPVFVLFIIIFANAFFSFCPDYYHSYLNTPNFILGGSWVFQWDKAADIEKIYQFQVQTAFVGVMAFVGAYCQVIYSLIKRINNNDMSPISYYFMTFHVIMACLVAGVVRLTFHSLNIDQSQFLVVIGFVIGLSPTLGVQFIMNKAMEALNFKSQTAQTKLPEEMGLLVLEGIDQEKISRLSEMSIDNCHVVACANPFVVWVRTKYSLSEIVDWISQARLYLLFKSEKMKILRDKSIRDIFTFCTVTLDPKADPKNMADLALLLGVPEPMLKAIAEGVVNDPEYIKLRELKDLL